MAEANGSQVSVLNGLVSILVPCCGQLEYTKLCVPSLLKHSREPYELIFIDIGSLDGTAEYLAGIKAAARMPVGIVRADTDLNIGEAVKEALGRAKGEHLVLLNNDTIVTHGWLNQLLGLVSMRTDIGMVGPMSNYAAPPQLVEKVPYRGLRGEGRGRGGTSDRTKMVRGNSRMQSTPLPTNGARSTRRNGWRSSVSGASASF